jgi:hypothetical protein
MLITIPDHNTIKLPKLFMLSRKQFSPWRQLIVAAVSASAVAWAATPALADSFLGPLNPGFEQGSASWNAGGTGGAAGSINFDNSPTNGPTEPGTNCVAETSDGTGNTDFRANTFSLGAAATGTNQVTFSFDYDILNPVTDGNNVRVGLRFFSSGGSFVGENNSHVGSDNSDVGANGWQHLSVTATPPSGAYLADVRVSMNVFGDDDWSLGTVLFDNFAVDVDEAPLVSAPSVSPAASVAAPATVTFQEAASGSTPLSYQWRKDTVPLTDGTNSNGSIITGSLSNILVIANSHTADSGSYDVVVTNEFGTATSAAQTLSVSAEVFAPSIQSITVNPTSGVNDLHTGVNPMTITVAAAGTGPLAYQWRKGGVNLANQTNTTLTLANALTNSGSYAVVVANAAGSVTSTPPTVISVVDATPMAMTLTGGAVINALVDTAFVDPGYTIVDDYGSTVKVTVAGSVKTNLCGTYTLQYTATDTLGNSLVTNRTVNVCLISESFNESAGANGIVSQAPGWHALAVSSTTASVVDYTTQTSPSAPSLAANAGNTGAVAGAGYLDLGNVSTVNPSLVWKDTTTALQHWQLTNLTFYTLDTDSGSTVQIAIRVGTNWYASTTTFADSTGGVQPWAAQTFSFSTAAADWQLLDLTTLQPSGSALSTALPNYSVSAVGFLGTLATGSILVDEFQATGLPATFPVTPPQVAQPTVAPLNPADGTAWAGTPLYFQVAALGTPPLTYQWRKNGVVITAATNNPWILNNPGTANSGNYDVVLSNSVGAVTSAVVAVTVSATVRPSTVVIGPLNPGFEQGSASWNAGGTGGAAGSITFANEPTNGVSAAGTNCVAETSNGSGNTDFRVNEFSLGDASTGTNVVTFSFDYDILNVVTNGNNVRVGLRFFDASGANFQGENNTHIGANNGDAGGNGWQHFSVTVTPPSTAYNADIRVSMNVFGDDSWALGTVLFDNFTVRIGAETTPVAGNVSLNASSGAAATLKIIGGTQATTDLAGDPVIVATVGTPSHGTASTDGTNIIYVSEADYTGTDSFTYTVSDQVGGIATAHVAVTVATAGSNKLASPVSLGANQYQLTFSGIPSGNYALEWTGSLTPPVTWTPQTTNSADANGSVVYTNSQTATPGFWRTRYVP